MSKKILLINDMVGYGKVALSAAMPILIHKGYELYNLPTVLISNTLNYGKFATLDTTEYMKRTVAVWDELGFTFDAISVGFIASDEQAAWLADFCTRQKEKGAEIFLDPIMGDNGKLYNSVTPAKVACVKELVRKADYIVPNYTEACHLSGAQYQEDGVTEDEMKAMLKRLVNEGAKSVIITSLPLRRVDKSTTDTASTSAESTNSTGASTTPTKCVGGYDAKKDEYFTIEFEELPYKINGSGDTFLAILMSHILDGKTLKESADRATKGVSALITKNIKYADSYNGLPIEAALDVL